MIWMVVLPLPVVCIAAFVCKLRGGGASATEMSQFAKKAGWQKAHTRRGRAYERRWALEENTVHARQDALAQHAAANRPDGAAVHPQLRAPGGGHGGEGAGAERPERGGRRTAAGSPATVVSAR